MFNVYGDVNSGNCYKVKLVLEQLGLPYQWQHVDIAKKESSQEDFLTKNPNGKIPVLETSEGQYISESNAIMFFLAEGTQLMPMDIYARTRVLEWLFFEQYSHEPYVAVVRYIMLYLNNPPERRHELARKKEQGYKALEILDNHLASREFLVEEQYSIADIGLYAYTHVADEGGFDLSAYTAIASWIERIKSSPKYVALG